MKIIHKNVHHDHNIIFTISFYMHSLTTHSELTNIKAITIIYK